MRRETWRECVELLIEAAYRLFFFAVFVLIAALIFVGPWFMSRAKAAELTDVQAVSLYAMAYGQLGGTLPPAPVVHITSVAEIRRLAGCEACPIRAFYTPGHVYLDRTLDFASPFDASILLHEFVHHLQAMRAGGQPARSCEEWVERERQAYTIQAHVLERAGVPVAGNFATVPLSACSLLPRSAFQ